MTMTTTPRPHAIDSSRIGFVDFVDQDHEERPRFAAQRAVAARLGNLPQRMLLNRARCEGEAHRRSESAEQEALR